MIDVFIEVGLVQVTIATLAAIVTVGVAFLARPGTGTLYWSIGFGLVLLATCGLTVGRLTGAEDVVQISSGVLFSGTAILWSGFRIMWGRRPYITVSAGFLLASTAALALSPPTSYPLVYRTVFLVSSVFALFFIVDWLGRPSARREAFAIPLVIASVVLFGVAVQGFLAEFLAGGDEAALDRQRLIGSITLAVYVICALIAELGFTLRESPLIHGAIVARGWQQFERVAAARVSAAAHTAEPVSAVCLRLDDDDELRQLMNDSALSEFLDGVRAVAASGFAPGCLVGSPRIGTFLIVTVQPDSTVRAAVADTLARVMGVDTGFPLLVRSTASAGWASAGMVGYDLRAMIAAATVAAERARASGGNAAEASDVGRVDSGVIPQSRQ